MTNWAISLSEFLLVTLATWRLAYLLAREDAPFRLMAKVRARWPLGGLLTCLYCTSVWAAIICYLTWLTPARPLIVVFAASGGALLLWRYTGGSHGD